MQRMMPLPFVRFTVILTVPWLVQMSEVSHDCKFGQFSGKKSVAFYFF